MVVYVYWVQHCSGVATTATGTTGMAEGIVEEGIGGEETIGVETIEEIGYGENGFLNGISSTQETKNSIGLVAVSKLSKR